MSRNKSTQNNSIDQSIAVVADYYQKRALEYDAIYKKPEQQNDFQWLRSWLSEQTRNRQVLEVACGTGYWTAVASSTARRIVASDINSDPLKIAETKMNTCPVEFRKADAFDLPAFGRGFDCGMAHFWLSHIPKSKLLGFIKHFVSRLEAGSVMLFIDSKYVSGYRKAPVRCDSESNTYQLRKLKDGSNFEIVNNFLAKQDILNTLHPFCKDIEYKELDYLWAAKATVCDF